MSIVEQAKDRIIANGPNRVVISPDGEAVNSRRARENHRIEPDVIFIRNDGWTLGAPSRFEGVAFGLWADHWIGFMRKPSARVFPIGDYQGRKNS